MRIVIQAQGAVLELEDGRFQLLRRAGEPLPEFAARAAAVAELTTRQRTGLLQRIHEATERARMQTPRVGDDAVLAQRLSSLEEPEVAAPSSVEADRIADKLFR